MEIKNVNQLENYFRKGNLFGLPGVNRVGVFGSFARDENLKTLIC